MAISKIEAKDKPCIFIFLASKYPKNKLLICEIGEQRWRNASSKAAVKKIQILAQYFPELNLLLDFLKHYSLCQTHYNNLVARNTLINKLEADNQISLDPEENNKSHNFHDFEIQVSLLDPEYNKLLKKINELKNINRQLLFENELLKNKLKERFNSQQDHMKAIIEIAKKERNNLYDDLTNLMEDYNQFYLDSLLNYSLSQWLSKRNPVVVKFIEILTLNENENQLTGEKLFKCAVAVDVIYETQHLKYVSVINLAASAIKYSVVRSRSIVDIDNHFISASSFTKFIKWQENLAGEPQPFPNGLIVMAFDNEQKSQKNYLDRGHNTVVYNTVTSFVLFNFDPTNQVQNIKNPWLHENLNTAQIEQLFDITPEMQTLIDQRLHNYLSAILTEASIEKNKDTNRKCPQCNTKLPTIAEIQQEINQMISKKKDISKPLVFKFYHPEVNVSENSTNLVNPLSITQKLKPQNNVNLSDILVPDPLLINPNSIANIQKVLDYIKEISKINKSERKWIAVVCDEIPYRYTQKFKNNYPEILLIPGLLHEEMNMLKAFVELNWYNIIRYITENQLSYFKKCIDHHKAWESVCNIYRHSVAMKLVWPYVDSNPNPTVNGYLNWAKNQNDDLYKLKYKQGICPIWSARKHPIYQEIKVANEEQLMRLHPEIQKLIGLNSAISRSGWSNQHQGLDTVLGK
ncbi:hypothetical protein C2G38_2198055 [Gigaspora rosea]|uniref:Uncharacterized protein n=1 Tax=Gigaspora rosea TaxID=44941 RepID=A0A397V0D9_9GLOM|nr:hypothetical protein C2G38_2198055 [Gigaspora rosea]